MSELDPVETDPIYAIFHYHSAPYTLVTVDVFVEHK